MTPGDKRRLAVIRKGCGLYREDECGKSSEIGVALFLLRLLDEATAEAQQRRLDLSAVRLMNEAIAERDAAMAALRDIVVIADDALADRSAATKPTEEVSG